MALTSARAAISRMVGDREPPGVEQGVSWLIENEGVEKSNLDDLERGSKREIKAVRRPVHPEIVAKLQRSTTLAPNSWENVGDGQAGTGAELQFTDPSVPAERAVFYRILIWP